MGARDIGNRDDRFAIGSGSLIAQIKRLQRQSQVQYDLPPMWGASRLRNEITKTDDSGSAQVTEDTGELKLSTGANGNDRVELRSAQYAQYRSGLYGEAAFGVRMTEAPSGDQVARWGYFDDDAGFGWGIDATSLFTFYREAGKDTIYRPPVHADTDEGEWNLDPLDGNGQSGLDIDILDGSVFHTLFRLYGHGPIIQYAEPKDAPNDRAPEVAVDQRVYPTQINLVDFNRQLRAEVENNGTDQNLDLYIAGRQYSLWGDKGVFERRDIPTVVEGYSPGVSYEPIIAVRKQPTFPPGSGRGNSVSVRVVNIDAVADGAVQLRLTFDADVTNEGDFSSPDGWDNTEAATETINVDDTAPQVDGAQQGLTVAHAFVNGSRSVSQAIEERSELPLGADTEAVLWAKSGGNATVKASMTVEEQW